MTEILLLQEAGRWDVDEISRETDWTACCNSAEGRDVAIMLRRSAVAARAWTCRTFCSVMVFILDDPLGSEQEKQQGVLYISAHLPDKP
eukprot:3235183-Karenia_brevis.AAC.1